MQDLWPALPLVAVLEARVARHEVRQERVQLVLCAQLELERVHEGDEVLVGVLCAVELESAWTCAKG